MFQKRLLSLFFCLISVNFVLILTSKKKHMSQKNTDKAKPLSEDKANLLPVTDASSKDKPEKKKRQALYSENVPTFYCGVGNNSDL